MRNLVLAILSSLILFVAITYTALEAGDVVVVETQTEGTSDPRETHIWYVQKDDGLFLEAGNPQNPWIIDLASQPTLTLRGEALDGVYRFTQYEQSSHQEIRRMMRDKYGWRDWWISLIFDTSQSYMIEITKTF